MKTVMCALLGLTPSLLAWNYAAGQTPAVAQPPRVVVVREAGQAGALPENVEIEIDEDQPQTLVIARPTGAGDEIADGEIQLVRVVGGPNQADGQVVVTADAQATDDGRSDSKTKRIKVITKGNVNDSDAAQRGWLGVSVEVVPDSMAAQLGTQKMGVMVGNVVEGSPAHTAGIQANDMIVAINGEEIASGVGPAVDLIKSRKPGETINVGIVRDGKPQTLKVTLGSRADMKNFNWVYEGMPSQVEEQIKTRGKFMTKGPNGELIVQDLGDLDALKNLPDNIRMFVPRSGSRSTQVTVNNGQKTIKMNVQKDGSTMSIEQENGGPITVSRTDDGGQQTVDTYDNEDALKAGDQDAYDLYSQAGETVFVHVDGDDDDGAPHVFFQGGDPSGQWKVHLEQSLADAKVAYGDAMQELHKNLMELQNQGGTFDVEKFHSMFGQGGPGAHAFAFTTGKPTHRFNVKADGSIEVSIRKGDSEMSQSFKNEADMSKRRPDLYEKYQDVKAADEE